MTDLPDDKQAQRDAMHIARGIALQHPAGPQRDRWLAALERAAAATREAEEADAEALRRRGAFRLIRGGGAASVRAAAIGGLLGALTLSRRRRAAAAATATAGAAAVAVAVIVPFAPGSDSAAPNAATPSVSRFTLPPEPEGQDEEPAEPTKGPSDPTVPGSPDAAAPPASSASPEDQPEPPAAVPQEPPRDSAPPSPSSPGTPSDPPPAEGTGPTAPPWCVVVALPPLLDVNYCLSRPGGLDVS